jgi:serine/threonine-protein kinase
VILRCLAKRPDDRYPDALAVAAALGACGCAADWDEARAEGWWLEQTAG